MKPLLVLYALCKLQRMSVKTLKRPCINLYLVLNSELHEDDWFEELSHFYKNCSTRHINSGFIRIYISNKFIRYLYYVLIAYKILKSTSISYINRNILKVKNYQKFCLQSCIYQ